MITAKDIQVDETGEFGSFTEVIAYLKLRRTVRVNHADCKSRAEVDARIDYARQRVIRELLDEINGKRQSCLEGMLERGEAWKCQCGSINGNLNTRCCQCGKEKL